MLDAGRRCWTASPLATLVAPALLALAAASPLHAQVAGPNVNMVSGTQWPGGDPFLQRQNEPSVAVSTRNPSHLLAGANDYRTVDLPLVGTDEVGDAWLGVFKSFDGGLTWQSTLLPGYPQDTSGTPSPLKGFKAAADPVVRAGTDGLFYYSGITFNRGSNVGQVFVSRFLDRNDREGGNATQGKDPIRYVDATVIETGTSGQFLDKPWLAVDVPRGAATCTIAVDGQTETVGAGIVYMAYAKFTGSNTANSQVMFVRSLDCGKTWSKALKISPNDHKNQGTNVAVDPASGTVYVTYRRFETNSQNADALVVLKSTDFGQTFTGVDAALIKPFDQFTTPAQFRTATLPALAASVDPNGVSRVHLAWAERSVAGGDARIVVSTSRDGVSWSKPVEVDGQPIVDDFGGSFAAGHQFMPSLTFGEGRLMVLYYDQRLDQTLGRYQPRSPFEPTAAGSFYLERRQGVANPAPFGAFITEPASGTRRLLELRIARAFPADLDAPTSSPFQSSRVSRFRFGTDSAAAESPSELDQLDVNPPNLPLFKQGTLPFIGDYIEVAGLSFVKTAAGWKHNTELTSAPTFHAVWTSNQDVVPPPDGHWEKFTPLGAAGPSLYDPTVSRSACVTGFEGTRNQNVYASRITEGLLVYSPQNAKPLDVPRAFVVIAQNLTPFKKTFRFGLSAPSGVYASFQNQLGGQDQFLDTFDVVIPPNSSISRSVFTKASAALAATLTVNVTEIADVGEAPLPTGLSSRLLLNPPGSFAGSAPSLVQPDGSSGTAESYTATISAASVTSPNLASVTSASVTSASVTSASVTSASVTSASVTSSNVASPQLASVTSASVTSASVTSYNISDASVTSQPMASVTSGNLFASVTSASVTSAAISDANYEIKNTGNTTHSYHVKLVGQAPANTPIQLILSRPYATPFAVNCQPWLVYRPVTVVNVDDVSNDLVTSAGEVPNPDIPDPRASNATITLAPGESGVITVRGPLGLAAMSQLATTLVPAVVPHAGGSYAAPLLITSDGAGLPALLVGVPYSAMLTAIGGTGAPVWSLVSGSLPAGLTLSPSGLISGTPTAAGNTSGTVQVSAGGSSATKEITFSVAAGPSITSLAVSSTTPVYGSPLTLTVSVSASTPGTGAVAPAGTVVLKDGGTAIAEPLTLQPGSAGQSTATLQLSSLAAGAHALGAEYSGDANYTKSTSDPVPLSVSKVRPVVSVTGGTFTYDGAGHPATASVAGVGGSPVDGTLSITYSPGGTLEPVNAGSYVVTATFLASDVNYEPSTSGTGTVVVLPATPQVAVGGGPFAYDGQPHGATASVTGVGGASVAGTTSFSYTPGGSDVPVAAGTYAVAASFTSSDPNYAKGSGSGSITIGATVPTVTVTGGTFVYDGKAHAATATAKGVAGATVAGSFAFTYNGLATAPANAGSYAVVVSFTSGDANYGNATGTGTLLIAPATPSVAVAGGPFTYDGAPHPASATATGVGGTPVAGGFTFSYTPGGASAPVAVNSYGVAAAFTSANTNYTNAAGAGTLVVNKAATTTTVTSSLPTSGSGVQVTFTASVKPAPTLPAGAAAPGGTVAFKDGTTTLGTATLSAAGTATLATSTLTAGTHTITAVYGGDATFNGSTSAALTQTVTAPYTFIGFQTPLATAGTLSAPSASGTWGISRVLPIKWQLLDSKGANVTALSSTRLLSAWFAGATCPGTSPVGSSLPNTVILYQPTVGAAGGSTFRSGSTGFIFNWDATKASKGPGCYWIRLQLDDGSPEKVTTVLLN